MRSMSEVEIDSKPLSDIISAHAKWTEDANTGSRADLSGADLRGANLGGANLGGANGIMSFGPVGSSGRIGYAVIFDGTIMFALGCHWGNLADTCAAIVKNYGAGSLYEKQVRLASEILQAGRGA